MKALYWIILMASLCHVTFGARNWRKRPRSTCATTPRLQDKWHFLGQRRVFIRIRTRHFVFKNGNSKTVKYKCIKNSGNIYLLRKRNYRKKESAVLCLGFSYVADHPKAEYSLLRLMGRGEGSHLMSPIIVPNKAKLSIKSMCDLDGSGHIGQDDYTTHSFIRRSLPGCKFPKRVQGRWNYTYQHAKSLEIWSRNSTLHLMNGKQVKFHCDKKDGGIYVFRAKSLVDSDTDAIMCIEFETMPENDPYYKFKLSRHNSGRVLGNQLRAVPKSKPIYVQIDCDWIGSPARPEFLYP